MTKYLVSILALSLSTAAFAAEECDTALALQCSVSYIAQTKVIQSASQATQLANENWSEPSETNCAGTLYFDKELAGTTVRIYANKSLSTQQVEIEAEAIQTVDKLENGQNIRDADYSNFLDVQTQVNSVSDLGVLHLPNAANGITDISVSCQVK